MQDDANSVPPATRRTPWNKGKLIGAKPPLRQKPDGSFASLPAWMTEPAASRLEISDEPHFPLHILRSMRAEVDALLGFLLKPHGCAGRAVTAASSPYRLYRWFYRRAAAGPVKRRQMRSQQSAKIREIGDALRVAGYVSLDEQTAVLGLSRSTAWTVLRSAHKASGLTAAVINRMLAAPGLPRAVRATILEYVQEKITGTYGHSAATRRKFMAKLSEHAQSTKNQTSRPRA